PPATLPPFPFTIPPPPSSPLFPYTTLFRSVALDRPLVVKGLVLFAGAVVAWLAGGPLPLVAIAAGALMVAVAQRDPAYAIDRVEDRKSTRLNSSHDQISYAVFCLKKKTKNS